MPSFIERESLVSLILGFSRSPLWPPRRRHEAAVFDNRRPPRPLIGYFAAIADVDWRASSQRTTVLHNGRYFAGFGRTRFLYLWVLLSSIVLNFPGKISACVERRNLFLQQGVK